MMGNIHALQRPERKLQPAGRNPAVRLARDGPLPVHNRGHRIGDHAREGSRFRGLLLLAISGSGTPPTTRMRARTIARAGGATSVRRRGPVRRDHSVPAARCVLPADSSWWRRNSSSRRRVLWCGSRATRRLRRRTCDAASLRSPSTSKLSIIHYRLELSQSAMKQHANRRFVASHRGCNLGKGEIRGVAHEHDIPLVGGEVPTIARSSCRRSAPNTSPTGSASPDSCSISSRGLCLRRRR